MKEKPAHKRSMKRWVLRIALAVCGLALVLVAVMAIRWVLVLREYRDSSETYYKLQAVWLMPPPGHHTVTTTEIAVRVGGVELGQLPQVLGREHGIQIVPADDGWKVVNGQGQEFEFLFDGETLPIVECSIHPLFFSSDYDAAVCAHIRGLDVPDDMRRTFRAAIWKRLVRPQRPRWGPGGREGLLALRRSPYGHDYSLPDLAEQWPVNLGSIWVQLTFPHEVDTDALNADALD